VGRMKVVAIIQARINSTRLPSKIMLELSGKTILEHDIERIRQIKNINQIVIATTENQEDIQVENEAKRLGVELFRGSSENVLSRYYNSATKFNADIVVRFTSDCPLIDPLISQNIIDFFIRNKDKYDFVSNTIKRTYPRGLDTEVFSYKALEEAYNNALSQSEIEHVTPYIWSNPEKFRIYQCLNDEDFSMFRWTVDTKEDFELVKIIYQRLYHGEHNFYMHDILKLFQEDKSLFSINECVEQKKT
jgi:spore coat polysaccharide biosynthesis protein SpsF